MTPQEAQMLQQLVDQVAKTPLNEKDPDAEALLKDGLARDPDAIYKLAQIVIVQDISLHQAQARIQQLTAQVQQQPAPPPPARTSSFLGNLLHRNDPAPSQQPYGGTPQYQPVSAPPPPPQYAAQPQPQYAPQPSAGGSFLRSAATTAAGVAAGALAFQGIESIFHGGFGGGYGFGGFGSPMGFGGMPVEETVINNNYINDPSQTPSDFTSQDPGNQDFGNQDLSGQDFANQDFGNQDLQQSPFDATGFDSGNDPGFDSSNFDDGSSFDGGGFDSGNDFI